MDDFSNMRYAHCDGYTDICFDQSGEHLITCGADGDIRIMKDFDDDDPLSQNMGKVVTAVAIKDKMLYVATDTFSVSAYTFPEIEFDSIIAQYNSGVYHIVCTREGNLVASGGGDFIIKVYDTSNKSLVALRGHTGPVLSLAFECDGKYLASTGCDGTFRIWELNDQQCIKTLNILEKSNDRSLTSSQYRLSWSPNGKFVAVPVKNEVHLFTTDIWECAFVLTDDSISQNASVVAFSPFGNYIAAATLDGQLVVWNMEKKSCISRKSHEKKLAICNFSWNPSGNDIIFCDVEGQLGIYEKPLTCNEDQIRKIDIKDIPIDFECGDDDDGDKDLDENDANDLDMLHDFIDDDDENAFDIGAIKAKLEPTIFGTDDDDDAVEKMSIKSEGPEPKVQIIEAAKPLIQKAFQPSSTPVGLDRRFMRWNTVGIVRCYNTHEENSIDVEFHDTNVYHPLHLNNTRKHTFADLSTEALLMACPIDNEISSKLECLHFGTWDSNKEWTVEMSENEEIQSVALGEGFAACVTDKRFLRIFTISGVQCEVISVPGPVVCSAARQKQIIVAYHRGLGIDNDQSLSLMVIDVKLGGHCTIKDYSIPLSPKSFLRWLGYTDEGHPCVVDSFGIVTILNSNFGMKWMPVANTSRNLKGKSDTYFVLGLSEIKEEIRCILCKGAKYPGLLPRPTVIVIPFSLPFCEMSADKGRLEEENRRCSMTHKRLEGLLKEGYDLDSEHSAVERKWMDALLKMFALATRNDREFRALDIAVLMPNPVIVQGAIRYATQRHRMALAERLGEVMNNKLLAVDEDIEMDPISDYESVNLSQNSSYSKSMRLTKAEDEETILKPKPLSRAKYDSPRTTENSEMLLTGVKPNAESLLNDLTPKASPISNPFKSSQNKLKFAKKDDTGVSNIDSLLDESTKNLHNKCISSTPVSNSKVIKRKSQGQKNEVQAKLNNFQQEPQPKKHGFQLFLEEKRDTIVCASESEMVETEIVRTAMKMYKELSEIEKQKYLAQNEEKPVTNGVHSEKTDEIVSVTAENCLEDASTSSKRKGNPDTEDDVPKPKKLKKQC